MDLGIDPFLVSASLIAIIGQRLVRGVCQECKIPDSVPPEQMELILPYIGQGRDAIFWKGTGCEACQFTGYSGRLGLFEVFTMTPALRRIISPNLSAIMLKEAAEKEGFLVMAIDGITKAMQGLTTIDEVFRVAPPEARESTGGPAHKSPAQEEVFPEEPSVSESKASVISVSPKKILVVDDNAIILKLLRHLLEAEDYLVITAENGLEGLKMASTERPNLIITDFLMPKMDGVTLIRKLKSQMSTRFIPIIMLTAKDEVESEVEVIDAGADDYLTKPVVAKRLLVRVARLLSS